MSVLQEKNYTSKFDLGLWKRLARFLIPYWKVSLGLVGVMLCVGVVDVIFPLMNKYAIDTIIASGDLAALPAFALKYAGLVVFQAINVFLLIAIAGKIEMSLNYDIRKTAFKRLQELDFTYYDKTAVGWIMTRMTSDNSRLADIIAWGLVDATWSSVMMIGSVAMMLVMNWRLALVALAVVPVLAIISLFFQKKILKAHRDVRKTNSRISGAFNEGIMGAKTTKTLVREEANLREFSGLTGEMQRVSVRAATFSALYMPIVFFLGSVGTALALWYGGYGVIQNVITLGTLAAFIAYTVQFFEPITNLAGLFAEMQSAQAAGERIMSLIDTEPSIKDSEAVLARYGVDYDKSDSALSEMKGAIEFRNVSFSYKDGAHVLKDFNLTVRAGEKIALVGETGSGKSTIVNLACRFYEPTEGEILIDGVEYRERPLAWLHANLGYVLQTPHLFSGTIRDNIRYGRLNATDTEIERVAQLVNAHDFIMKLEKGYDTEVGEGGNMLSTGQKQLISFARALLAEPRIFVLDEATSSVDTETEQLIQLAIHTALEGRTSFIIAHRLSTIRSADRILVIKNGTVIESGTHHELLNMKGYYYRLYTNQFMEEEETRLLNATT